ncbi:MAG: molybdopterin-synthase adenylyltransferase MoeB [Candidatus Obscuribacterales bacterium]|jgi:molybdopterin/thiamine biosynthesis adenylyltransferase/rhodanese-related sulfurtransferase
MTRFKKHVSVLEGEIPQIGPAECQSLLANGKSLLIDVREPHELAVGRPLDSINVPKSLFEQEVERHVPEHCETLIVICASGARSLLAAKSLLELGYKNVFSVSGGFNAWLTLKLPVVVESSMSVTELQRFARQIAVPEIGIAGQEALRKAKVLIVGAGGLGSPCALYLAAIGIGCIGIADGDRVELSNLHRQVVHSDADLGENKALSAVKLISNLNSTVKLIQLPFMLTSANVLQTIADYDVVVDASDNFSTRRLLNDACLVFAKPHIHGAVHRFEGFVTCFTGQPNAPCYRCLFPDVPSPDIAPPCSEAGVLGLVPGVIGLLQSMEVVKLVLREGDILDGKLLRYNSLRNELVTFEFESNNDCVCYRREEIDFGVSNGYSIGNSCTHP